MRKNFLLALLCLFVHVSIFAQRATTKNALLWKVTGKDLQQPSYLFGTYHFLTNGFIDTIPAIKNAMAQAGAVAGELLIDESLTAAMMEASTLKGTTLKQLLPDTLYTKASLWFKEEAGIELEQLNQLNPITLVTIAMAVAQQKYMPNKPGETQLDSYVQKIAKSNGKKVIGLETIDVQIAAMFGQLTERRQVELLDETFRVKNGLRDILQRMHNAYVQQNMQALQQIMYGSSYSSNEMKVLLDDRNDRWMQQLPSIMQEQSTFVAVGALHLIGEKGLVQQLKSKGYTVTPVNLNSK